MTLRTATILILIAAAIVAGVVVAAVVWSPWVAIGVGIAALVLVLFAGAMRYGAHRARRSSVWDEPR